MERLCVSWLGVQWPRESIYRYVHALIDLNFWHILNVLNLLRSKTLSCSDMHTCTCNLRVIPRCCSSRHVCMGLGSVCMTSMNEDLCGPCLQQRLQPTARLALFCSTAASFSEDQTQIHTSDCIEFPFFLPYSCYCSLFKIKYVNAKTITSHLMNNKYHFFAAVLQDVGFSSDKLSKMMSLLLPLSVRWRPSHRVVQQTHH